MSVDNSALRGGHIMAAFLPGEGRPRQNGSIAPAEFATADGLNLSADIAGEPWRSRIIFLHGGAQSRRSWRRALEVFALGGFSVVSYDLRGHGESDWSAKGDYSLEAHVSDLISIVRSSPGRPILIGASLGGRVALAAAAKLGSEVINCLVLVDLTPRLNAVGLNRIRNFLSESVEGFADRAAAAAALSLYAERPLDKPMSNIGRSLIKHNNGRFYWRWDPQAALDANLDPVDLERNLRQAARRLEVPTLLVRGTESDLVTPDCVSDFLRDCPSAEVVNIEGQGHLMKSSNWEFFCNAALEFVHRHTRHPVSDPSEY
ncbi:MULTISPECIES: alpha/beta hydrolase [unclassified Chelatococcus]|uniref:alpha/beta fold hydrolase n=1 Tax=unclassified Chelatococcus TaxID=2638111 RepID=UPI001BCD808D|nr:MULTISPECIES: alpha/beta hydrolase [unclassified Chelatococcus]MBS7743735.1 alpha/beta hydrolase [Chelatococcus sp. HY11]MBX3547263.1 alpha/beta hydrolase [Chelatococcus sp.]CAH1664747.1 Alpha/beta hydrolase [Hyphomicrobiales bacterium]CAH1688471.1 Alpha/beta hydrolase [Hyphomicrobiales bacterium]